MIVRAIFIRIYRERRVWVVWFFVYLFVFFVMFLRSHTHTLMTCVFFYIITIVVQKNKKEETKTFFFFLLFFIIIIITSVDGCGASLHHFHRPYYMHMNKSSFFGCLEDNLFTITLHTHPNHITSSLDFFFLTSSSLKK